VRSRPDTLASDTDALYSALNELVRVYQFRDRDRICCHGVSVTQCHLLDVVCDRGPLTLNEVAAALFLEKSTTSRVVDALERKGLVTRTVHPSDRRAVLVAPTGDGRSLRDRIRGEILTQERALLRDVPAEVRAATAEVIGRLARSAAARVACPSGASDERCC
jgi:MarR family transcriptional regulator, 2-MHQ and catechol-resistance regulon repressor